MRKPTQQVSSDTRISPRTDTTQIKMFARRLTIVEDLKQQMIEDKWERGESWDHCCLQSSIRKFGEVIPRTTINAMIIAMRMSRR
jgi:hypothetical protein